MLKIISTALKAAALISMLLSVSAFAQHKKTMTMTTEGNGKLTIIQGLGAIVIETDNNLKVDMTMPKDNLPKEYKDVDLKKNDQIIMCNGKRVKTVDDLNEILENAEVGASIELGIKRDKQMLIVAFPKADESAGGQMMMMTTTIGGDGADDVSVLNINGKEIKNAVLFASGLVVHEDEGVLKIATTLPMLKENIKGQMPSDGDEFVSLNDVAFSSANDLRDYYHGLKDGTELQVTLKNDSGTYSITFNKMKMENEVKIEN